MGCSIHINANLLQSTVWLCASKGQLAYGKEGMAILGGLELITIDHNLNKDLLLLEGRLGGFLC
jgi:hypothetical protein